MEAQSAAERSGDASGPLADIGPAADSAAPREGEGGRWEAGEVVCLQWCHGSGQARASEERCAPLQRTAALSPPEGHSRTHTTPPPPPPLTGRTVTSQATAWPPGAAGTAGSTSSGRRPMAWPASAGRAHTGARSSSAVPETMPSREACRAPSSAPRPMTSSGEQCRKLRGCPSASGTRRDVAARSSFQPRGVDTSAA